MIVYNSPDDTIRKNRGFAFLDYDSHKSASAAKRTIGAGRVRVWGSEVYVDWAEPQDEPDDETMSKVHWSTIFLQLYFSGNPSMGGVRIQFYHLFSIALYETTNGVGNNARAYDRKNLLPTEAQYR